MHRGGGGPRLFGHRHARRSELHHGSGSLGIGPLRDDAQTVLAIGAFVNRYSDKRPIKLFTALLTPIDSRLWFASKECVTMTEVQNGNVPRDRSPSFPFISLKAAIARLSEFEQKFNHQEPPADRTYLAWGMKGDTSQAQQTLAALKSFGLVEYKGAGVKRPVGLTDEARTYLRAQQEAVRKDVLKRLALKPRWIAHFWPLWGASRGPDEVCLDALVLTHKFNENSAPKFLSVYDETITFAGLSASDKITPQPVDNGDDELAETEVSGSATNLNPKGDPSVGLSKPKGIMMEGERELTTGLLSKGASFRLIVSGHIGAKEIDRLIRKLQLDKEILADQDLSEDDEAEVAN